MSCWDPSRRRFLCQTAASSAGCALHTVSPRGRAAKAAAPAPPKPVLVDADSANEIDDLFAIAQAVMEPGFHLQGLTSAQWHTQEGAPKNTVGPSQNLDRALLHRMRREDIPHPQGANAPLPDARTPRPSDAADFIIEAARRRSVEDKLNVTKQERHSMTTHRTGRWILLVSLVGWTAARAADTFPPRATLEDVAAALEAHAGGHPRVLATPEQLQGLSQAAPPGSARRLVGDFLVREAEDLLDVRPITRSLQGRRLLGQSRRCVERVLTCATAYHLTGDDRFARRAEKEMLAAAAFSDWNPSHYLDVGEMTFALAFGYDWLFDVLPESSRQSIRTAIVDKGLRLPFETKHKGWVRASNNWGQVCHGGMVTGALAVYEDEPELAARTVHNALANVHRSMHAYAPNGSYPEGPSYWGYGTSYNVVLLAALDRALQSDFGLSLAPGFDRTGAYPALVTGPSGFTFNYADGGSGRDPEPALFWFARQYDRPDWLHEEHALLKKDPGDAGRLLALSLLWLNESPAPDTVDLPLHWNPGGEVPITLHRSSWNREDAVFVGLKGGSPSANHGNMDTGSFVLDADGVRWALDLGAEGYHGIESRGMNLWDRSQDSDRWTIFRQQNHGHNTLVIDNQLQQAKGFGAVERFSDNPHFPFSVLDMTSVYTGQATSVRRGVALLPSRNVVVQDELEGLQPGATVRWGMITPASPGTTGTGSITLTQGGQTLTLEIDSPEDAVWIQIDSATPQNEWDSPNRGTSMIAFEAKAPTSGTLDLRVIARPGSADKPSPPPARMQDW